MSFSGKLISLAALCWSENKIVEFVLHSQVASKELTAQIERSHGCSKSTTKERKESINKIRHYNFPKSRTSIGFISHTILINW